LFGLVRLEGIQVFARFSGAQVAPGLGICLIKVKTMNPLR